MFGSMSELRKADTDYPFFVTMTIVGWIDIFTRERYCEAVLDTWFGKRPITPWS